MALGKDMLIKSLVSAFGLDEAMVEQIVWAVETVRTFDDRLKNIERKLAILTGAEDVRSPEYQDGAPAGRNGTGAHGAESPGPAEG